MPTTGRAARSTSPIRARPAPSRSCGSRRRSGRACKRNADFNGAEQEGIGLYQLTQKNGERWSAARAYLAPNLDRPNLDVRTGAHATRIVFEDRRAVGVEYRQGGVDADACARGAK